MDTGKSEFARFLLRVRKQRTARNPKYSLRAFARDLGINSGTLSAFLAGRIGLTDRQIKDICERLAVSDEKETAYVRANTKRDVVWKQASGDELALLSNWKASAVLALAGVPGFTVEPRWIAEKLGIPTAEAAELLDRMKQVGVLVSTPNGAWAPARIAFGRDARHSDVVQRGRREILELGAEHLAGVAEGTAEWRSLSLPIRGEDLPHFHEKMTEFCLQITKWATRRRKIKPADRAYCLMTMMFPLQKPSRRRGSSAR